MEPCKDESPNAKEDPDNRSDQTYDGEIKEAAFTVWNIAKHKKWNLPKNAGVEKLRGKAAARFASWKKAFVALLKSVRATVSPPLIRKTVFSALYPRFDLKAKQVQFDLQFTAEVCNECPDDDVWGNRSVSALFPATPLSKSFRDHRSIPEAVVKFQKSIQAGRAVGGWTEVVAPSPRLEALLKRFRGLPDKRPKAK
jgi:hypothetical protein